MPNEMSHYSSAGAAALFFWGTGRGEGGDGKRERGRVGILGQVAWPFHIGLHEDVEDNKTQRQFMYSLPDEKLTRKK